MSYALAGALGALAPSAALPLCSAEGVEKNYLRDLSALPWLCSVFEARHPRLLPAIGKRLNLDTEGGYQKRVMDATGTGNLKTWFFIQEVPQGVIYDGAIFGPDPFAMASRADNREVDEIIIRTGRHLGGLVSLRRQPELETVRLNAHTAYLFGQDPANDPEMAVDVFALYDIQLTVPIKLEKATAIVGRWRNL